MLQKTVDVTLKMSVCPLDTSGGDNLRVITVTTMVKFTKSMVVFSWIWTSFAKFTGACFWKNVHPRCEDTYLHQPQIYLDFYSDLFM